MRTVVSFARMNNTIAKLTNCTTVIRTQLILSPNRRRDTNDFVWYILQSYNRNRQDNFHVNWFRINVLGVCRHTQLTFTGIRWCWGHNHQSWNLSSPNELGAVPTWRRSTSAHPSTAERKSKIHCMSAHWQNIPFLTSTWPGLGYVVFIYACLACALCTAWH